MVSYNKYTVVYVVLSILNDLRWLHTILYTVYIDYVERTIHEANIKIMYKILHIYCVCDFLLFVTYINVLHFIGKVHVYVLYAFYEGLCTYTVTYNCLKLTYPCFYKCLHMEYTFTIYRRCT